MEHQHGQYGHAPQGIDLGAVAETRRADGHVGRAGTAATLPKPPTTELIPAPVPAADGPGRPATPAGRH
jgi:hypothetical protein